MLFTYMMCMAQLQHNRIFVFDGIVSFITDNYNSPYINQAESGQHAF